MNKTKKKWKDSLTWKWDSDSVPIDIFVQSTIVNELEQVWIKQLECIIYLIFKDVDCLKKEDI